MRLKGKWPEHLIVPSEDQFSHEGRWVTTNSEKEKDAVVAFHLQDAARQANVGGRLNNEDREVIKYHCGTSCCLVGWAALAFGEEGCSPSFIRNPATVQFLNKFLDLAGRTDHEMKGVNGISTGWRASNFYEGKFDKESMSPRRARSLWKKTGDFFGYETGHLLAG